MGVVSKTEGKVVAGGFTGDIVADAGSIGTTELAANAVTMAKLVDYTGQGYITRGGSSGAPEEHDASGDGKILVGDGTDITSVAVSGDVTLANTGAVTIAAGAVEESMLATAVTEGLNVMRTAKAEYDFANDGGAISAIDLGITLPDNAIIVGGFVDVITTCTSSTDAATIAISVEGADDIVAAVAISAATDWDAGLHAIVPKANTPESTGIKLTSAQNVTVTIAVEAVTAGKFEIFLNYVVSD